MYLKGLLDMLWALDSSDKILVVVFSIVVVLYYKLPQQLIEWYKAFTETQKEGIAHFRHSNEDLVKTNDQMALRIIELMRDLDMRTLINNQDTQTIKHLKDELLDKDLAIIKLKEHMNKQDEIIARLKHPLGENNE